MRDWRGPPNSPFSAAITPRRSNIAERASQAAPNDPQLWFLLGYAARLNGKTQQSIDAYSHGLRLSPNSLDGISGLAQTDSVAGKNEEAERLLKQVLAADPRRSNDALVLGDIYIETGGLHVSSRRSEPRGTGSSRCPT